MPSAQTTLRIARPTDRLEEVVRFYRDGLGFAVIASFEDHAGFDGMMLGLAGATYHLEFTRQRGHTAGVAPSKEHLLAFYLPDHTEWLEAIARLEQTGYASVAAHNPYWDIHGRTYEDPDGYRVVLQNRAWS